MESLSVVHEATPADVPDYIPKGYASDSTVALSTHEHKRKIKKTTIKQTRKLSESTLTRHYRPRKHSTTDHREPLYIQSARTKPVVRIEKAKIENPRISRAQRSPSKEKSKRKLSQREYFDIREKENERTTPKEFRKRKSSSSKSKEATTHQKSSKDWHDLHELSVNSPVFNTTTMNRSHSFSSCGELTNRVEDSSTRNSGQWVVYGFI